MKRIASLSLLILISSILGSCGPIKCNDQEISKYLDTSYETERRYFEDNFASDAFHETYGLEHLIDQKVYAVNDVLNFELHFTNELTSTEVRRARDYYSKMAFDRRLTLSPIPIPYTNIVNDLDGYREIILRVFVEEELLLFNSFDFSTNTSRYYENMCSSNVDRLFHGANAQAYIESLESVSTSIKNVEILKPYKGYVVYFRIRISNKLTDDEIKRLKKVIETKIAPNLEDQAVERYGMNTNSLGIVIEISDSKIISDEFVYFNGIQKEWMDVEWKSFDFFLENSR